MNKNLRHICQRKVSPSWRLGLGITLPNIMHCVRISEVFSVYLSYTFCTSSYVLTLKSSRRVRSAVICMLEGERAGDRQFAFRVQVSIIQVYLEYYLRNRISFAVIWAIVEIWIHFRKYKSCKMKLVTKEHVAHIKSKVACDHLLLF